MNRQSCYTIKSKADTSKIPKELDFLALEARKYKSAEAFADTLGIPEKNIVWITVFVSSVEGKQKPNDIDIFVAVKNGSMKFKKSGGLYMPVVKDIGKLSYFIMPESEAENLLNYRKKRPGQGI
jgi:hypothetical protein